MTHPPTDKAGLGEDLLKEAIFYGTDPDTVIVGLEAALKLSRLLTRAANLLTSKEEEVLRLKALTLTEAWRAVDACGGVYDLNEKSSGYAAGHKAALDAACAEIEKLGGKPS